MLPAERVSWTEGYMHPSPRSDHRQQAAVVNLANFQVASAEHGAARPGTKKGFRRACRVQYITIRALTEADHETKLMMRSCEWIRHRY